MIDIETLKRVGDIFSLNNYLQRRNIKESVNLRQIYILRLFCLLTIFLNINVLEKCSLDIYKRFT